MQAIYEHCAYDAVDHYLFKNLEPFVYWHVCESIREGYTPSAVGCFQETAEIEAWILEQRTSIRDRTLGLFISTLKLSLASDKNFATAVSKCEEQLSVIKAPAFDGYMLDTTRIYEYIEDEKQNCGLLDGYSDWHWIPGVQTITQWTYEFKTALDLTRTEYTEACQRLLPRFEEDTKADLALLKLVSSSDLVQLLSRFAISPKRVPKPVRSKGEEAWDEEKCVLSGKLMRRACLDLVALTNLSPATPTHSILLHACNAESDPAVLVMEAEQALQNQDPEEAVLRTVKQKLTSALQILGERDGSRNQDLRIVALNNRASINFQLASHKKAVVKYYQRAIFDWKASLDLDQLQDEIAKKVQNTEELVELLDHDVSTEPNATTEPTAGLQTETKQDMQDVQDMQDMQDKQDQQPKQQAHLNAHSAPAVKAREKTILESPFFRADLVSGLMVDALLSLRFPHRAFRDTLRLPIAEACTTERCSDTLTALADKHHETMSALSGDNWAQMKEASQAVGAVLALPIYQNVSINDAPTVLKTTSLRLVLGVLCLLQNNFVKAQTELDLVSNALRPAPRSTTDAADIKGDNRRDLEEIQSNVQGHTLLLLAKTCWLQHKSQEANKYFRWFTKWHNDSDRATQTSQNGSINKSADLDMRWWDRFVLKKLEA